MVGNDSGVHVSGDNFGSDHCGWSLRPLSGMSKIIAHEELVNIALKEIISSDVHAHSHIRADANAHCVFIAS